MGSTENPFVCHLFFRSTRYPKSTDLYPFDFSRKLYSHVCGFVQRMANRDENGILCVIFDSRLARFAFAPSSRNLLNCTQDFAMKDWQGKKKKTIERKLMVAEKWLGQFAAKFDCDETYPMHSFELVQIVRIRRCELRLQSLQLHQDNFEWIIIYYLRFRNNSNVQFLFSFQWIQTDWISRLETKPIFFAQYRRCAAARARIRIQVGKKIGLCARKWKWGKKRHFHCFGVLTKCTCQWNYFWNSLIHRKRFCFRFSTLRNVCYVFIS